MVLIKYKMLTDLVLIFTEPIKKVKSQKDYLKKYLSSGKKRKEKVKIQKRYFSFIVYLFKHFLIRHLMFQKDVIRICIFFYRVQIIDDNIDCVEENIDIDVSNNIAGFDPVDEFAPQIVGVVDERPQDVKILDTYKNKNRWKRIGEESDTEEESNKIDVDQVKNYVQNMNKSTLKDLIKADRVIHLIMLNNLFSK